jgi:hypothetical protein
MARNMRKIKKTVKVQEITRYLYNRAEKSETTDTVTLATGGEMPPLPENCILIEQQVMKEKEVTYAMDGATFFKYATIEE